MRRIYALTTTLFLTAAVLVGCNQSPNENAADATSTTASQTIEFANAKCPIMGGKPKAELTAQYKGKTIGFCCEGCPDKWAALSEEEKAEKFAEVSHGSGSEHDSHEGHENHDHGDHS